MSTEVEVPERRSIIETLAKQYNMEASKFQQMVQVTCFPANPPASPEEFAAGMQIAHRLQLNPITKEVHFARTKGGGIQAIIGVDGWYTMANRHPEYDGCEFSYEWEGANGNKKLFSVTCRIFRKDRTRAVEITEYMAECARPSEAWRLTPSRMLRHRAFGQCARVAFSFAGVMDHDEFERWQEEATPPVKRMSSAAAKRDGTSVDRFKELLPKLENATDADACKALWLGNTELLKTAARSWFEMLSQAFVYRMRDLGVTVDVDDYGWPILPIDEIPHLEPAKEAATETPVEPAKPDDAHLDQEASEAALAGFVADLAGAHTLNKITRVWNKWDAIRQQCCNQAEFLRIRAEAMKRVKDSADAREQIDAERLRGQGYSIPVAAE